MSTSKTGWRIASFNWATDIGRSVYSCIFNLFQNHQSQDVISGNLGGHSCSPLKIRVSPNVDFSIVIKEVAIFEGASSCMNVMEWNDSLSYQWGKDLFFKVPCILVTCQRKRLQSTLEIFFNKKWRKMLWICTTRSNLGHEHIILPMNADFLFLVCGGLSSYAALLCWHFQLVKSVCFICPWKF